MFHNLLDGWFKFDVGEGAFYALFGFLFVFTGIVVLILIFTALGKIMKEINKPRAPRKKRNDPKQDSMLTIANGQQEDQDADPELIAVISAAIAAYYEGENAKCEFVVKRIKKL